MEGSPPSMGFDAEETAENDEVWDDTLLIDAYEKSSALVEAKLKELTGEKASKPQKTPAKAKLKAPSPPASQSELFAEQTEQTDQQTDHGTDQPLPEAQLKTNILTPPPPTFLSEMCNESPAKEDDALASMLMSWYMCGYQTGYYAAIKQMSKDK